MGDQSSCVGACRGCRCLSSGGGGWGPHPSPSHHTYPCWASRRQYWGALILLAICCSCLYVVLYYHAAITSHSVLLFNRIPFIGPDSDPEGYVSPTPYTGPVLNEKWNSTELKSQEVLVSAIDNRSSVPLLTLFSSWADRPELEQVRNLTLENWARLKPTIVPVLFTNSSKQARHAEDKGWYVMPVSRAAVGVPILKNMYLDIMARFNSTLYAFANGDILFTETLVDTLLSILGAPQLPLDSHPLLVVGQRINVPMVKPGEVATSEGVSRLAKRRGRLFTAMAEDYFVTDRTFPWHSIPGVVIGRTAYDNWLVLSAIRRGDVVVDATKTLLAVHQTTKAGNFEGFTHANASYNNNLLTRMYKKIQYMAGCVDCAPWRTRKDPLGKVFMEAVATKPRYCSGNSNR